MSVDILVKADKEDKPLTRADVERLLREAGSPDNLNLSGRNLKGSDLTSLNLMGIVLNDANLSEAELFRADLTGASLIGANLRQAYLSGAILTGAQLTTANLYKANLIGADLRKAILIGANLSEAYLFGADFSQAYLQSTTFGDVDLAIVKGLETVNHLGPSTIGANTIVLSQGHIPETFLKGAGVSDIIISFMKSLAISSVDYYTCFISYSSKDQAFAERLYADLQSNGVRCWFAPEDMKIGDSIRHRIDESIRLYDKLLLVLSEHSVASQWIEQEVEAALQKERQQGKPVLFPIRLDNAVMESNAAWATHIRHIRHIGDFTGWKQHDDYQQVFDRLLRDLKADSKASTQKTDPSHGRESKEDITMLRVRIVEEPLTAQNFSLIISTLTELHTKCWLIAERRLADLIEFTQTRNLRFVEEAGLIITKLSHNSPADIGLTQGASTNIPESPLKVNVNVDASPKGVMEAVGTGIDALAQAPLRYKEKKLETQAKELEMKQKELEAQSALADQEQARQLALLEAQSALADKEQARQLGLVRADLETQKVSFEIEKQKLELEKQQVALQRERLELEIAARNFAFETADMLVERLYPGVDAETKAMLSRTLVSSLLQLSSSKGLVIVLPSP